MNTEKMFVRSITGLPSTVLFAIYIAFNQGQEQITVDELMGWVMVKDDDSVRQACETLVALDLIGFRLGERGKKHYHLTDSSQQFLPGMMPILPVMPGALPNPVSDFSETGKRLVIDAANPVPEKSETGLENGVFSPENSEKTGQNPVFSDSGTLESSLDRENLESIKNLEDSNYLDSDEFAKKTTPEILCKQAHLVLGRSVRCDDVICSRSVREILGWIAHAYQAGHELSTPYGFVYRGLRRELKSGKKIDPNKRPDPQFVENPFAFLPYSFLDAVGLGEYHQERCPRCGLVGEHTAMCLENRTVYEEEVQVLRVAIMPDESDSLKTNVGRVAMACWESHKEFLKASMPNSAYDTWVVDAKVVDYRGGIVYIGSRNQYARDWLDNRLEKKPDIFSEMLDGFCSLEFVISSFEEA